MQMNENLDECAEQKPVVAVGDLIPVNWVNADDTVYKQQALVKPQANMPTALPLWAFFLMCFELV